MVLGFCPMGCGRTVGVVDGRLKCLGGDELCPRPHAAAELLAEEETEHIIAFDAEGWTIQHPLRERLDDGLFSCELTAFLRVAMRTGPPNPLGRYRATCSRGNWTMVLLP